MRWDNESAIMRMGIGGVSFCGLVVPSWVGSQVWIV